MTTEEKLAMIKTIMGPDAPDDVPSAYEMTQVYAVVNGFTQRGLEGQSVSIENGIHRHFDFTDMTRYIRQNVIAYAKV